MGGFGFVIKDFCQLNVDTFFLNSSCALFSNHEWSYFLNSTNTLINNTNPDSFFFVSNIFFFNLSSLGGGVLDIFLFINVFYLNNLFLVFIFFLFFILECFFKDFITELNIKHYPLLFFLKIVYLLNEIQNIEKSLTILE